MDNPETQTMDNPETQAADAGIVEAPESTTVQETAPTQAQVNSWKEMLGTDLRNSPLAQKFDDSPEGLNKFAESHANLEKLLGHEKVPIPKGDDDVEGWNRFSKALGIPDKAEGYGLPDAQLPEGVGELGFDKNKFAELAHSHKLTPAQAKGLWESYTKMTSESYAKVMRDQESQMDNVINQLRGEWGDAYDTNVELGQMVINKFADNPEMNDYVTAALSKDPQGIKFLAKLGDQFAENQIGEFQMKKFSLGPEQAIEEIDKITRDMSHPYNDPNATPKEHEAAIDYVNSLYIAASKSRG